MSHVASYFLSYVLVRMGSIPTTPYILPGKYYEFRFSYESSYFVPNIPDVYNGTLPFLNVGQILKCILLLYNII